MKRFVGIGVVSMAISMFMAGIADAARYEPSGETRFGPLSMGACSLHFSIAVSDRDDQAQVTSVAMEGPPDCAGVVFHDLPYMIEISNGAVTISSISASFDKMDASCAGSIVGSWDEKAQKLTFVDQFLPGKNGGCGINGAASPDRHFEFMK